MFFVARFALEHIVLHGPNEREFYTYEPNCGAWVPRTLDAIKAKSSEKIGSAMQMMWMNPRCSFCERMVLWKA
jgi:hypothetical protein